MANTSEKEAESAVNSAALGSAVGVFVGGGAMGPLGIALGAVVGGGAGLAAALVGRGLSQNEAQEYEVGRDGRALPGSGGDGAPLGGRGAGPAATVRGAAGAGAAVSAGACQGRRSPRRSLRPDGATIGAVSRAPVGLVYAPALAESKLRPDHPLKPARARDCYRLLEGAGALGAGGIEVFAPPPADVEDVLGVHTRDYVEAVRALSAHAWWCAQAGRRGPLRPLRERRHASLPGMFEYCLLRLRGLPGERPAGAERGLPAGVQPRGGGQPPRHALPGQRVRRSSTTPRWPSPGCWSRGSG